MGESRVTPDSFSPPQAFHHLLSGSSASPEQVSVFLMAQHFTKLDKELDILVAAAAVLHDHTMQVEVNGQEEDFIEDIVGMGGEGWKTFNVRTTAAKWLPAPAHS